MLVCCSMAGTPACASCTRWGEEGAYENPTTFDEELFKKRGISPPFFPPQPSTAGWICPKCGKVWGPQIMNCPCTNPTWT